MSERETERAEGWYEFITNDQRAYTSAAYVYESGNVYVADPELTPEDFNESKRAYRLVREPRTIITAEELEALPVKAVIRGKWLAEKWATPEGDVWFIAGRNMEWFTDDLVMRGGLPATVLDEAQS